MQMVQQWPPVQRLAVKDEDGEDANAGIDVQKARERLFEEDKFDKEEYRRRIKEKHRVSKHCTNSSIDLI